MKNSFSHLPLNKQNELLKITAFIQENCFDIEKIILFGSYARGNYKEAKDISQSSKSGHISDYDILVISKEKKTALDSNLWNKIGAKLQVMGFSAYPKLLIHDIDELNKKLSQGQYFFSDVVKEGILLFDKSGFELTPALKKAGKLSDEEKRIIAREHFKYWFQRAENFLKRFNTMFLENQFTDAAFDLHQAAESCYKGTLLVFTNYTPREHFLAILGREAEKHCSDLQNIFPKNKQNEERFSLLEYAYIGGRYDSKYIISKNDLEILANQVRELLEVSKRKCEEKINNFLN
jgi:HEPN domain-containing protein/predicted nucleotidyltransferase